MWLMILLGNASLQAAEAIWQAMQNFGKAKLGDGPLADDRGDCWEGVHSDCSSIASASVDKPVLLPLRVKGLPAYHT